MTKPPSSQLIKRYLEASNPHEIEDLARPLGLSGGALSRRMQRAGILRRATTPMQEGTPQDLSLSALEQTVLTIVRNKPVSVGEISRRIDKSSETVIKLIDSLRAKHHAVELDEATRLVDLPQVPTREFTTTGFDYFRDHYRIGLVSDTQIGSKYQQMTLLHDAYAHFEEIKVDCVLHAGDLVDGVGMYRGQHQETFLHNAEEQRKYTEWNYPVLSGGRKTYVLAGNHDYSFYKANGYDIVEHICEHREDLIYRGFFTHTFDFKGVTIRLEHPGGGVAYARSYRIQKHIENITGFVQSVGTKPPALMTFGHWHIPLHLPQYMGVDAISLPCFQAQTPYLVQKGLSPTVGYATADVYLNEEGNLAASRIEFVNMNDRIKEKDW